MGLRGAGLVRPRNPGALARPGRVQRLRFDRVNYHTKVWLNGVLLGENRDGWMPFEFDVTGRLHPDRVNHLVLRVDNRPRPEWLPGGKRIEWVQYGGVIGPVSLDNRAPTHVADLTIVATSSVVRCTLQIACDRLQSLTLRLRADTAEAQTNFQTSAGIPVPVTLSLALANPRWWSPETPHLYDLEAAFRDGAQLVDRVTERFGLRHVSTAGRQILLNGRPLRIRGVNRYDELAPYGPNPPRARVLEDLQTMRRAGINAVRVHYPQSPELITL